MSRSHRYILNLLLTAALLLGCALTARAQTDAQFTQYFEVPTYYNPAAIGNHDYIRIRVGSRLQWVGIDNAPTTFVGLADMPLSLFGKKFGVGVLVQQESTGLFRNLTAAAQIGYKLQLKKLKSSLTIALQPGILNETFKGSKVFIPDGDDFHNPTDEAIPTNDVAGTAFDLGVGAWFEHPRFYTGLSLTHAMSPTIKFSAEGEGGSEVSGSDNQEKYYQFQARRTLYFTGGGNIPIKNTLLEVLPSVLFKTDFRFWTAEATARVRYNKWLTAGIGYRYDDAVMAMVSAEFKGFFLGYSFDYALTDINRASSGSHEIFLGYKLKLDFSEKNKNKHKSIRIL